MKRRKRRAQDHQTIAPPAPAQTDTPKPAPIDRSPTIAVCITLAVLTLLLYWRVQHFEFIRLDDGGYGPENQLVARGLTWDGLAWAFTGTQVANWHPLTTLSLMLNCQLFGPGAGSFHLVNVFLHVANTLLLFLVLKKMTGAFWRSAMVAALFAWHPLHIESVAWVSERKDVLSALFWLLAIWAYVSYVGRPQRWRYVLTLFLFALGLMSKPMVVTLPCVLLLLDYWPLQRTEPRSAGVPGKTWRQLIIEKTPFFALVVGSSAMTIHAQEEWNAVASMEHIGIGERIANAIVSYERYLEKTVWPAQLSIIYPNVGVWPWWRVVGAVVLLLAVSALVFHLKRRTPYMAVGWCWFLGTLVPVIGLVQVGIQSMADRYTYLPLIGIFIIVAWGMNELLLNVASRASILRWLGTGALAGCLAVSWVYLGYWRNSLALFRHTLKVTSNNWPAHKIVGNVLVTLGRLDEARDQYEQALRIAPANTEIRLSLARLLGQQGKTDEAMHQELEVLRIDPKDAGANYSLGNIYYARGEWDEAAVRFAEAARLNPNLLDAKLNLASALVMLNRLDDAAGYYLDALRTDPNNVNAHSNLGIVRLNQGRTVEAGSQFREALRINADFVPALDRLAWLLATDENPGLRDGTEAVRLAEKACALTQGKQAALLDTLAAAYAEAGRFPEAIKTEQQAIHLAADTETSESVQIMQIHLQFYTQGQPYHESTSK